MAATPGRVKEGPCEGGAMTQQNAPAIVSTVAVVAVGLPALWLLTFGPLATHMALHIALVSVMAPLFAMLLLELGIGGRRLGSGGLWGSTVVQLLALWAVHAPS